MRKAYANLSICFPLLFGGGASDVNAQSPDDVMYAMDIIVYMQICDSIQPGFKQPTARGYAVWRTDHRATVNTVEAMPQIKAQRTVNQANITPEQKLAYARKCARLQRFFTEPHPDPRFATPEKTWDQYLERLRNGQREAALDCLVKSAFENLVEIIEQQSPDFLRQIGTGYEPLRRRSENDNHATYIVTRNGQASQIEFVRIDGEWRISGAP